MGRYRQKIKFPGPHHLGFTLIEVIVVMFLLAIIAGSVGLNLIRNADSEVREEAERMAILINMARDQAILEGRFYGFRIQERGYAFLRLNAKGELKTIEDDALLRNRNFSDGVLLGQFTIDGNSTDVSDNGFIVTPTGQVPSFSILLSHRDSHWRVYRDEQDLVQTAASNE